MQHPTPSQPICTSSSKGSWALSGDVPCPEHQKKTYGSGMRQFFTFCSEMYVNPQLPISEDILINFSVAMARSVQYTTIKNYLSAVKNYHSSHGYDHHLSNFLRLWLILRGFKRSQGHQSKVRRPITLRLLNLFYHLLNVQRTDNRDSLMLWEAMTLAFFGFLRIGELTCNSTFDPKLHLMNRDITFMPFRQGQTIVIGKTNSPLCPISAMVAYLNSRPLSSDSGPLFTYVSGGLLTRKKLTRETRLLISKRGLDSMEFAGHGFRIGAATTAASANLPPWLIKVLGRWSSDCFERYLKTPPSVLAQVPQKLVRLL